jgi:hypothetical protein
MPRRTDHQHAWSAAVVRGNDPHAVCKLARGQVESTERRHPWWRTNAIDMRGRRWPMTAGMLAATCHRRARFRFG